MGKRPFRINIPKLDSIIAFVGIIIALLAWLFPFDQVGPTPFTHEQYPTPFTEELDNETDRVNNSTQTVLTNLPRTDIATHTPKIIESIVAVTTPPQPAFNLTVTLTPIINTDPVSTVAPIIKPEIYILQKGEWAWCIARRFDVDPYALLQASGLTIAEGESPITGMVLTIPASANTFPTSRILKPHPASYTVASGDETVGSIACSFGDVDPNAIISANSLGSNPKLTVGQVLQIP